MRLNHALVLIVLAGASACHAGPTPAEFELLFGHRIQLACVAQDPAYQRSAIGRALSSSPNFPGWSVGEQLPFSRCLRERKFLDKALCDDVTGIDTYAEVPRDVSAAAMAAALQRHAALLETADDVLYLQDDAWAARDRFTCPATLPRHSKTP